MNALLTFFNDRSSLRVSGRKLICLIKAQSTLESPYGIPSALGRSTRMGVIGILATPDRMATYSFLQTLESPGEQDMTSPIDTLRIPAG